MTQCQPLHVFCVLYSIKYQYLIQENQSITSPLHSTSLFQRGKGFSVGGSQGFVCYTTQGTYPDEGSLVAVYLEPPVGVSVMNSVKVLAGLGTITEQVLRRETLGLRDVSDL